MANELSNLTGSAAGFSRLPVVRLVGCLITLVLCGCQRDQIVAYDAPKESSPPASVASARDVDDSDSAPARPGLRWKRLPEGWASLGPAGMRVANFSISGGGSGPAQLSVIPLPGTGGSDLELVNLWRGQLNLPPIGEAALPQHAEEVVIAGKPTKLFQIVGASDSEAAGNQIVVAALLNDGFTWFFKLAGDAATVATNRPELKSFLAEVEFTAPEVASGAPAGGAEVGGPAPPPQPTWQVPGSWKPVASPQMVHSKWSVVGDGGRKADITVSVFPGETGGLLANLNRWRNQVGLGPASEGELATLSDNMDVAGGKGTLVDLVGSSPGTGDPSRMVGAVVRRDGMSWFYKLFGEPGVVEANKEAFVRFVQSVKYPPRS